MPHRLFGFYQQELEFLEREGQKFCELHPDIAGSLAKVATLIGEAGGNIVEVQHQRVFGVASVKTPEVEFVVETRDKAHTAALVAQIETARIKVTLLA